MAATLSYATFTPANAVTYVRTALSCALFFLVLGDPTLFDSPGTVVAIGFAVYWAGDILDGAVARFLDTETRGGAVLDTLCDRACTSLAVAAALQVTDPPLLPVGLYLVNFLVLDFWLSLRFVDFDCHSNNYFYEVDRTVYLLNWHPVAKASNSALVLGLAVFGPAWLSVPVMLALMAVKSYSWWLLRGRPA